MKAIAIGGVPATGKTTLVKAMLNLLKPDQQIKYGMLRGSKSGDNVVFGIYESGDTFAGTDRLSMAVQKHYDSYIDKKMSNIVFEGDRLFTGNNICKLINEYDTRVVILEAEEDVLDQRHIDRQDNQGATFLKSRYTKINNICKIPEVQDYIERHSLMVQEDTQRLSQELVDWLNS